MSDTAAFRHEAMKLCRDCPIIAECLAGAIENREKFGVWGGLTETQRRALRRRRVA